MTDKEQVIYRFSESPIWEMQRSYYEDQGLKAWLSEEVPQYITNNPMIATSYAEIIFGFLQDRARLGHTTEPVIILELGAGSGRLAFHVLKELCELRDEAVVIQLPPFCYCMSDFALKNITFWQQHRSLKPFVDQGILDFAHFDATHDTELTLTETGTIIRRGDLQQPLLVIANYFFDSIPQELIYVGDGKIHECKISLQYPDEVSELSPSELLERVIPEYHYLRADEYEQESYPYRDIIQLYQHRLEDSHILFPAMGLDCLERLGQLSQDGFLMLTADKGDHRIENWEFAEPPELIHHGSFSLTANYHAIQAYFEHKGALTFFTPHHYKNLNVGCMLMLQDPMCYTHSRLAYRRFVNRFGPDDFFTIKEWFEAHLDQMELRQILSLWRLGRYDTELFIRSADRMLNLLPTSDDEELADLQAGIHLMWTGYYPMGEKHDLAVNCGMLLFEMDQYEASLEFFERSQLDQAGADVLYNMAICYDETGNEELVRDYVYQALAKDPHHEGALSLKSTL
ncbi:tetratricopeptide repeat protein [Paenibacillus segetis]|uniref:Tetratricopeptide repeat-containing protein n=1 Tax=Paenibacillus segetis TaxID=1325360 RepID=A0ABQ1YFQ8_9BACL|nr:tetratricopeptide repeat protein [Paenibacillus segetis]GGH23640.1 hypothetical protein GCM10008013_22900 [Paenibacillus segetis]